MVSNSAATYGGGVCAAFGFHDTPYPPVLINCTVVGNTASWGGGGTAYATLTNCIVFLNKAAGNEADDNNWFLEDFSYSLLYHCCTIPLPPAAYGANNITNEPSFVNDGGGDLRLRPGSPCINAGDNKSMPPGPDLEGNSRVVGGTVDIGAYEFQGTDPTPFPAWLTRYGLQTDGSADYVDSDKDGLNNWQEWRTGTNPTNAASVLRMLSSTPTGADVAVSWESVLGMSYVLERSAALWPQPSVFAPILTNLPGKAGTTTFLDTNTVGWRQLVYRVGAGSH